VEAFDAMYYIRCLLRGDDVEVPKTTKDATIYEIVKVYAYYAIVDYWRNLVIKIYDELPKEIHKIVIPIVLSVSASRDKEKMFDDIIYWNNVKTLKI